MSATQTATPFFHPSIHRARDFRTAMAIDRLLVWTYRHQRADIVIAQGAGLQRIEAAMDGVALGAVSACGCAALARTAALGCQVAGGGGPAGHLHIDAERVHAAVMRLDRPVALLVIRHARQGDAPDWVPRPRLKPVWDGRGRPRLAYDVKDRARNYGWCLVEPTFSQARIDAARLEYRLWHAALRALHVVLCGRVLADYRALPPEAADAPWKNEKTA